MADKKKYKVSLTATHVSGESKDKKPPKEEGSEALILEIKSSETNFIAFLSFTPEDPGNFPFTIGDLRISGTIEGVTVYNSQGFDFPETNAVVVDPQDPVAEGTPLTISFMADDGDFVPTTIETTWAKHPPEG